MSPSPLFSWPTLADSREPTGELLAKGRFAQHVGELRHWNLPHSFFLPFPLDPHLPGPPRPHLRSSQVAAIDLHLDES